LVVIRAGVFCAASKEGVVILSEAKGLLFASRNHTLGLLRFQTEPLPVSGVVSQVSVCDDGHRLAVLKEIEGSAPSASTAAARFLFAPANENCIGEKLSGIVWAEKPIGKSIMAFPRNRKATSRSTKAHASSCERQNPNARSDDRQ
jgi:hypothetical protein